MERDTILFDLDGTLLPIDLDEFLKRYFKALTGDFGHLAPPEEFIDILMKATYDMINNDGELTNEELFCRSFFSRLEAAEPEKKAVDQEETMKMFNRFYRDKFPSLRKGLEIDATPTRLVGYLHDRGYQLIIATNAVFPREAIVERLRWIGLSPADFIYITSYENMHYCKPNLNYYREILEKLELDAARCSMVGNDMQEDMIAGRLGMATYLVEDYLIDRQEGDIEPDWRGALRELELVF